MTDDKRLIEVAFPLKQSSLDSVHEKNVRHGHISTLHIWPARRPLAASRAALISALLPAPQNPEKCTQLLERMAGRVVEETEIKRVGGRTIEKMEEKTIGGILHWGRENSPNLDWFRQEIRKAYDGHRPKVLDPFAGGGAIPLEAIRLGCEVTAVDINPLAWFILKCTLEHPQNLSDQTRSLPEFALEDREFMKAFLKSKGFKGSRLQTILERFGHSDCSELQTEALPFDDPTVVADLSWHVRAWGRWVLAQARKQLAPHYLIYADFEPLKPGKNFRPRKMRMLELDENGIPQLDLLNAEFNATYLENPQNPRWVAKPSVAYLWARTVSCKQCRATMPLLKTRWLSKKDNKRVLLTMEPNADRTGVVFDVETNVPRGGGNATQRHEHDNRIGAGTMSRQGAYCPCCSTHDAPTIMTMDDIRVEGRAGRLGTTMTAVVVDGVRSKEYRLPTVMELEVVNVSEEQLQTLYADIPFGLPEESTPKGGSGAARAFSVYGYGLSQWRNLFTNRQLFMMGTFVREMRRCSEEMQDLPEEWREAIVTCLALSLGRLADRGSALATWTNYAEKIRNTFARFALPVVWDFAESCPLTNTTGSFIQAVEWIARAVSHLQGTANGTHGATVLRQSATDSVPGNFDLICTDPPYYDAIPYSDLMDFFYVWIRRSTHGLSSEIDATFSDSLGPKWSHDINDGELIDDASRFGGDKALSKKNYEDGMARAFKACHKALNPAGRMVVVFANKQPDAWETLVAALIRAGFVVNGSWPIQTEMQNRQRSLASAALASSVWLVCKKRPATTPPGWDNTVLREMRENIAQKLRDFWDTGIRGPDFVWAATGPALEAYSKYPVVKKADAPGEVMGVSEFLREVRRIVVDFVVGRVLTRVEGSTDTTVAENLDDVTTYYLLHRHDFGMKETPIGISILYALSCNLSDSSLVGRHDLLIQSSKTSNSGADEEKAGAEDTEAESGGGSGAKVRLKAWNQRQGRNLGLGEPEGSHVPMIDQVHKMMHLWQAGDQTKVDHYLENRGLNRNALFNQLLQALIELSIAGSDERSMLESLSNHVVARERIGTPRQTQLIWEG